jgi:glutamine amidotransferase
VRFGQTVSVVVLDYGFGNVRSAVRAARRAGAEVVLTADPALVGAADGLIVPGVGAFHAVMAGLERVGAPRLIDRRLAGGRGVLGICVGLQVMFASGTEGGRTTAGLGQWPGAVTRLEAPVVPHMGWSKVQVPDGSRLFEGVADERFYFVHSYAAQSFPLGSGSGSGAGPGPGLRSEALPDQGLGSLPGSGSGAGPGLRSEVLPDSALGADGGAGQRSRFAAPLVTWADCGGPFVAAVEDGPLAATQFHPEKSGDAGARLIKNWIGTL